MRYIYICFQILNDLKKFQSFKLLQTIITEIVFDIYLFQSFFIPSIVHSAGFIKLV